MVRPCASLDIFVTHALRIAVKDAGTNERMISILKEVLSFIEKDRSEAMEDCFAVNA